VIDDFSAAPFEEIRESEPSASGGASKCGSLTTTLASSLEARRTICWTATLTDTATTLTARMCSVGRRTGDLFGRLAVERALEVERVSVVEQGSDVIDDFPAAPFDGIREPEPKYIGESVDGCLTDLSLEKSQGRHCLVDPSTGVGDVKQVHRRRDASQTLRRVRRRRGPKKVERPIWSNLHQVGDDLSRTENGEPPALGDPQFRVSAESHSTDGWLRPEMNGRQIGNRWRLGGWGYRLHVGLRSCRTGLSANRGICCHQRATLPVTARDIILRG